MNQIKKVLCVALCAAMILSFVGCGGQDNTTAQAPAQTTEQPAEEKPHIKRLRSILQKLGIIGESGSADIITLVDYMIEQGPESGKFTVSELCSKFSPNNSKSMEQRIRRTVNAGLTNLANMGIEDYSNDTFHDFAGSIYSFEQIRKEMDYIRGKSDSHGKVSLKNFLNSLIFYCTN